MEKEISSGTMLGIVLIALAAVIGLGFGVFSIAKGVANEGTVGVQDNLNTVTDSAFEDYNDKIVTGTQVKSAIQNFEGKSVAILVNTTAMNKGVVAYNGRSAGCTVLSLGEDGKEVPYVNYNALLAATSDGNDIITPAVGTKEVEGEDVTTAAIALAEKSSGFTISGDDGIIGGHLYKEVSDGEDGASDGEDGASGTPAAMQDGVLTICNAFAIDDSGKVKTDLSIGGLSRTGNCEYISTSSKFTANLIKDTSGTNVGILFTQMAK